MEQRERHQQDQDDFQRRDDRLTSQAMAFPTRGSMYYLPDEMLMANPPVVSNSNPMMPSLFRTEPPSNYSTVSMLDMSSGSPLWHDSSMTDPWMMALPGCSLYLDTQNPVWDQSLYRSPSTENMLLGIEPLEQQPFLPKEQEGSISGRFPTNYTHMPTQMQGIYDPPNDFVGSMENTMFLEPGSALESSSRTRETTSLTPSATHTRTEDISTEGIRMSQIDNHDKPYAYLIYEALRSAEGHRLTLQGIYRWFEENTNKGNDSNSKGWQNSVRHNLSMNAGFVMQNEPASPGNPKTSYWTLTEEAIQKGIHSTTRYRTVGLKKATKSEISSPRRRESGRKGGKASAKLRRIGHESLEYSGYQKFASSSSRIVCQKYGQIAATEPANSLSQMPTMSNIAPFYAVDPSVVTNLSTSTHVRSDTENH
ncbi:hypothetical protein BGW36DRAFT_425175 [Talaromyces proteolyticus]|uniref:Forkhead box protein O n=1 Tax=Talaromyces proteolyticus TaxID=1131652 RepID=A0AAD4KUP7_9EURO|nr:uncharacterized protein BGW36DRAFT_425175 [Talaromyces proteolyticus]KAH8700345.1 hypothetical protein BGW36DRAFT_425175 [Talaromyces proteolyticus]